MKALNWLYNLLTRPLWHSHQWQNYGDQRFDWADCTTKQAQFCRECLKKREIVQ